MASDRDMRKLGAELEKTVKSKAVDLRPRAVVAALHEKGPLARGGPG